MDENKKKIKHQYREFYSEIETILFKHDPKCLNFESNTNEYDLEVNTILPRLKEAKCKEDVATIILEEFNKWFGENDIEDNMPKIYLTMADEIWDAWRRFSQSE